MSDASHEFGGDLALDATGDLLLADGSELGRQRVLRRLMTSPGAYLWHLNYGAGLPLFVGEPVNKARIMAVTRTQMYRESVVTRNPAPAIGVNVLATGTVSLSIQYTDAPSRQPVVLNFSLAG